MRRGCLLYTCFAALTACDANPPTSIDDAEGILDADDPYCQIYVTDGNAVIDLDGLGELEVTLPPVADA
jgi:hypothetical protein